MTENEIDVERAAIHAAARLEGEASAARTYLAACETRLAEAEAHNRELQALFDVQWLRAREATAAWQAEDPAARELTWPDLGDLLAWLMAKARVGPRPDGARECASCGHEGSDDDASAELDHCSSCGATVPHQVEDRCPECGATGCQGLACPECGGDYLNVGGQPWDDE